MAKNRENTLKRIYEILEYIKNDRLISLLKDGENNYSDDELEDILGFLESGDLLLLYKLTEKKVQGYESILGKIRLKNINKKKKTQLLEEAIEKEKEEKELKDLLV